MIDNSKRTGAAIETHYRFLMWLAPGVRPSVCRSQAGSFAAVHESGIGTKRRLGNVRFCVACGAKRTSITVVDL